MPDFAAIRAKLPTELNAEQKAKRHEMFKAFDPNGNGYLSLAEVDKGVRDVLDIEDIFDAKPVIMRAFQSARMVANRKGKAHGNDWIVFSEFRMFLVYLEKYFEIWEIFEALDVNRERRINLQEFKDALPKLNHWGLEVGDPEEEFKKIDTNGGGEVLFDEFSHWALEKHLDVQDFDHPHA